MKFPSIYFITYTISDLAEVIALQHSNSVTELRQKVNILIIDDEEFIGENYLTNTSHIKNKRKPA